MSAEVALIMARVWNFFFFINVGNSLPRRGEAGFILKRYEDRCVRVCR